MADERSEIKVTASDALEFEPVAPQPKQRWGLRIGLFTAIAAIGGAAAWHVYGDRLLNMVSEREGAVQMVRAPLTPVKVRPENPGGLQIPNRDKLVYGRIQGDQPGAASGETGGAVERLLPPPETPLPRPVPKTEAKAPPDQPAATPSKPAAKPVDKVPKVEDVAKATPPPSAPPPPPKAPEAPPKRTLSLPAKATPPPPPAPKPAKTAAKAPAKTKRPAPAVTDPASAYRVQLAAARSAEATRNEWDRLRRKHLDLLGDLGLTVTKVDLGGNQGIYYRLRVGPLSSEKRARALCAELAKRKANCLVIRPGR